MSRTINSVLATLLCGLVLGCSSNSAPVHASKELAAERKAVAFLQREVPAWRRINGCFSCHNNGDGARALFIAISKGHRVNSKSIADTLSWLSKPQQWDHNKGDPGFSDQRLADIQFAAALVSAVDAKVATSSALLDAAKRVSAGQDKSGEWPIDRGNPVGSPATYGSALATFMAAQVLQRTPGYSAQLERARAKLNQIKPNAPVSAAVVLLSAEGRGHTNAPSALRLIEKSQTSDGGWGPYADSPPEPFDTAVVLIALGSVKHEWNGNTLNSILRGREFLLREQLNDGSWPATTRPPRGQSYAQQISTTAWALIALMETR